MQDIADESGIAKGTLYLYFKDRDELLQRVSEATLSQLLEKLEVVFARGLPFEETIRELVLTKLRFFDERRDLYRVHFEVRFPGGFDPVCDARRKTAPPQKQMYVDRLTRYFEEARRLRGRLAPPRPVSLRDGRGRPPPADSGARRSQARKRRRVFVRPPSERTLREKKEVMIELILAAGLLSQAPAPTEPGPPRLTLRAALDRAFLLSPSGLRAQDEVGAAIAQRDATKSLVLPRVNITGSLIRNSDEAAFGSGLDRRVILPGNDWSTRVTLQQPVYAGRREFRLYNQSKEGVTLARDAQLYSRDRIALRVIADYATAVQAQALVDVERQAAVLAQKRIEQAQALFDAGEVTRIDVLRAETALQVGAAAGVERRGRLHSGAIPPAHSPCHRRRRKRTRTSRRDHRDQPSRPRSGHPRSPRPRLAPEVKQAETNVRIADLEVLKQRGAYLPGGLPPTSATSSRSPRSRRMAMAMPLCASPFPSSRAGKWGPRSRIASARLHQAEVTPRRSEASGHRGRSPVPGPARSGAPVEASGRRPGEGGGGRVRAGPRPVRAARGHRPRSSSGGVRAFRSATGV